MHTAISVEKANQLGGKMATAFLGGFNRVRLGFPTHIFSAAGGIGDTLLCSTVFREIKRRHQARLGMLTVFPSLFEHSPDVDFVIQPGNGLPGDILIRGLAVTRLAYADYDPVRDSDSPLTEHLLVKICRMAGIQGEIELRPQLFLSPEERAAGKLADRQIVIQSSALGSPYPMKNKDWFPDRFQRVADNLLQRASIIQLGSPVDPLIQGASDLRGKTNFRQSAAILSNSLLFIGAVGFLMHLARAVDCRSVIVYGGRETPQTTGYIANANLIGATPCSPCWLRNDCNFNRECMNMISPEAVIDAALKQLARQGTPLETEIATLQPG